MSDERLVDSEVQLMASLSVNLETGYATGADDPWAGSPFNWIRALPSRAKGAVGETLVSDWYAQKGFEVTPPTSSGHDRIVEGHRIEVKLSTLWKAGGFAFQQIRDQDYDYLFCIGLFPFDVQAWFFPKSILREYVIGHMGQHTGATAQDTSWLKFQVGEPFSWMAPYGERLSDVERLSHEMGRGPHEARK